MGNSSDKNTIVLSICKSVLMNENLKESYVENLL